MWGHKAPTLERVALKVLFPLIRQAVRQAYKPTTEEAAKSLDNIKQIFEIVDRRLASGKEYLVGDNFSAADLTFAALSAPILRPANHPIITSEAEIPPSIKKVVLELRSTIAGTYALRLYKKDRYSISAF
jgi:glutathione S-transferase